jgi:hypothetical protein
MPRRRRTRRLPRNEYHAGHIRQLVTGHDLKIAPAPAWGNGKDFRREEAAAAWAELREEILADHITRHPCTRPFGWWSLDEPRELRRRVDGGPHPCLPPLCRPVSWGRPRCFAEPDEFEAMYESVPAYLARLGLLTRAERQHLATNPDLLEPVYGDDRGGWND